LADNAEIGVFKLWLEIMDESRWGNVLYF